MFLFLYIHVDDDDIDGNAIVLWMTLFDDDDDDDGNDGEDDDRPQKSSCTAAELQNPGRVANVKTAVSRETLPRTVVTRCRLREPEKMDSVPGRKSSVDNWNTAGGEGCDDACCSS